MIRSFKLALIILCTIAISACAPSREDADSNLLKACKAAIETVSSSSEKIHKITEQTFKNEKSHDHLKLRIVNISARITTGKNSPFRQREYKCYFEEKKGVFGIGYSASFYRLDSNGRIYGNVNGTIKGDFNDNLRINTAVEGILY